MCVAKNRLEEENQQLRDRLYDAELLIQLLKLKLKEQNVEDVMAIRKPKSSRRQAIKAKVENALQWTPSRHRETFRNRLASGKRVFAVSSDTGTDTRPAESAAPEVETPEVHPAMNSVVGKLAEVVLVEYAQPNYTRDGW